MSGKPQAGSITTKKPSRLAEQACGMHVGCIIYAAPAGSAAEASSSRMLQCISTASEVALSKCNPVGCSKPWSLAG